MAQKRTEAVVWLIVLVIDCVGGPTARSMGNDGPALRLEALPLPGPRP